MVLDKEREAEKLVLEAEDKAEKIRTSYQEKAEMVYRETYQETISEAKRKSFEIKEKTRKDAESEAKNFITRAEKIKKKVSADAQEKFDEAVDFILHAILS